MKNAKIKIKEFLFLKSELILLPQFLFLIFDI